jgi:hypothetical protein
MIPVYQDKAWDCQAAAIASIMEVPLETLPEIHPDEHTSEGFDDAWNEWMEDHGFFLASINFNSGMKPKGYTVGVVQSQKLEDRLHAIVCIDGKPVFDPQPYNERFYTEEEIETHLLFVCIDPSSMREMISD